MNKEKVEELIKKYEMGDTSLSEEQFLFDNTEKINSTINPWFNFIKRNKKIAPQDFNSSLWKSIQNRRIKKHRLTINMLSVAASIIILLSIFIYNKRISYKEKEMLLTEALNMFNNPNHQNHITKNIVYEDNMIIIYTTNLE